MARQKDLDRAYMQCAFTMSELSHARRKKVGAILVSPNGGIIAEGINGTPSGFDNVCEFLTDMDKRVNPTEMQYENLPMEVFTTKPEVLHAESNAIAKVARSTNSSEGATLYVTMSPCFECSKQIIQAGIVRVCYAEQYRITDGLDLLRKAGIVVDKLDWNA